MMYRVLHPAAKIHTCSCYAVAKAVAASLDTANPMQPPKEVDVDPTIPMGPAFYTLKPVETVGNSEVYEIKSSFPFGDKHPARFRYDFDLSMENKSGFNVALYALGSIGFTLWPHQHLGVITELNLGLMHPETVNVEIDLSHYPNTQSDIESFRYRADIAYVKLNGAVTAFCLTVEEARHLLALVKSSREWLKINEKPYLDYLDAQSRLYGIDLDPDA